MVSTKALAAPCAHRIHRLWQAIRSSSDNRGGEERRKGRSRLRLHARSQLRRSIWSTTSYTRPPPWPKWSSTGVSQLGYIVVKAVPPAL